MVWVSQVRTKKENLNRLQYRTGLFLHKIPYMYFLGANEFEGNCEIMELYEIFNILVHRKCAKLR